MNISVFGLGYVGCVSIGCLANNGHNLIGVDVNEIKIDLINIGKPTIVEKDIDEIIDSNFKKGRIRATHDFSDAVLNSDVSIICVGTPSSNEGHLDLSYIFKTAEQIGQVLKNKEGFHTIAIRSTVLPGTNEKYGQILSDISGKKRNVDFAIVSNPEFLREGTAVEDYYNPPVTVLGSDSEKGIEIMKSLYKDLNGPIEKTEIKVAESIKYVNNSFHALKITFANEVGNICKRLNIDSHDVMRLFCMDKKLNISSYYFKPGFAYGGSCLPKDLRALHTLSHDLYLDTPVINSIEKSNNIQKEITQKLIESQGKRKILILGISFKPGTDDLRYSPIVDVIQGLIGKGYEVKIIDNNVQISKIIGKNESYIMEKLPHIAKLLTTEINMAISWAEIIILTNKEESFKGLIFSDEKVLIDLTRFEEYRNHPNYNGLNW
ncbi:MAG: UDP-glucose/GDP-mannose dehydrogenase family protein [Candidatus Methanofastidiosa archaeon]|nr:UDP-glucose/GDP-mannose dehydrogenase family protein [Candidatus Methanofastidiosa archaeon]